MKTMAQYENITKIDIGSFQKVRVLAGSHNHIIIEKLYGPANSKDLNIVWEKDGWNILSKQKVRNAIKKHLYYDAAGMNAPLHLSVKDFEKELGLK